MGVIYSVACKTCKVTRNLDKFYSSDIHEVENRQQAIEYGDVICESSFRAGLLVSFMGKHKDHECVLFNDLTEKSDHLDPYFDDNEYKEDHDFWKSDNE